MRLFIFFMVLCACLAWGYDTTGMQANTWVNVWPGSDPLPINGSNWAYENDFGSHPYYGFFIMAPGHVVHPQDCYWYPYDPVTNRWTKIHSPRRHPRS